VILAVNLDSDPSKAREALSALQPKYTVLFDPTGELPERYNPPKMPTSFVIGRDGTVREIHAGFSGEDTSEIEASVDTALKEGT
jgi:peroxiredoxin